MNATREQVEELLFYLDQAPAYLPRQLAEQAVAMADDVGDGDLQTYARLYLMRALTSPNAHAEALTHFAWLLQHYDAAPAWLTDDDRMTILYRYKSAIATMMRIPAIGSAQIETALDDFARRVSELTPDPAPVAEMRYEWALHRLGAAGAQPEFAAMRSAGLSDLTDCEGCRATTLAEHHAGLGEHERALQLIAPVLAGEAGCGNQPEYAIAEVLESLVRTGQLEQAVQEHLRGSRISRGIGSYRQVAAHVHVLARTGNVGRGLDLFSELWPALDDPETIPATQLYLAAVGVRLLSAAAELGLAEASLRAPGATTTTVGELLPTLRPRAESWAAAFDARNGTDHISQWARELMEAAELPALPLGAIGRTVAAPVASPSAAVGASTPTTASVTDVAPPEAGLPPERSQHPRAPRVDDLDTIDPTTVAGRQELFTRLDLLRRFGNDTETGLVSTHWGRDRDAVLAKLPLDEDIPTDVAALPEDLPILAKLEYFFGMDTRAKSGFTAQAKATANAAIANAIRLYRLADQPVEAMLLEQTEAALNDDAATVRELAAVIDQLGTPHERARSHDRLVLVSEGEEGSVAAQRGLELLGELSGYTGDENATLRATAISFLTSLPMDDPHTVLERTQTGLNLLEDDELAGFHGELAAQGASVLMALEQPDAARAMLTEAQRVAWLAGALTPWGIVTMVMARIAADTAADTDNAAETEALFGRAIAALEKDHHIPGIAQARYYLASFLAAHGRLLEAIEVAEAGLATVEAPDALANIEPVRLPYTRTAIGTLQSLASTISAELGENARAIELARRALTSFTQQPDRGMQSQARFSLAELLTESQPLEALRLYSEALQDAEADDQYVALLTIQRNRAWPRLACDGLDAALADLDEALAANQRIELQALTDSEVRLRLEGWDFSWEPLNLAFQRVRMCGVAEQPERGLTELAAAVVDGVRLADQMRAHPDPSAAGTALYCEMVEGKLLLDAHREQEGLELLERATLGCAAAGLDSLRLSGARTIALWLDSHGRPEQAQAAWDRLAGDASQG